MTAEQFCYWLQGFSELGAGSLPTPEQWKSINDHLKTVFVKVTPPVKTPMLSIEEALRRHREEEQKILNPFGPRYPHFGIQPVVTC